MATFTIRDVDDGVAQAIKDRAAAAGLATEAYIRALLERVAQEPLVRTSYSLRALGPGDARAMVKRGPTGLAGQGAANMSQEQADAYKRAKLLVERNDPGDREKAIGVLSAVFEEVFEGAG